MRGFHYYFEDFAAIETYALKKENEKKTLSDAFREICHQT